MRIDIKKILKNKYKSITIGTPLIVAWIFFGRLLLEGFFGLNADWRKFIPIMGLSIIGIILYILKRHPDSNQYWIDSMAMLIIGIGPVVESFPLLSKDDYGRVLMPIFAIFVTVIWFVYFGFFIKPDKHSDPEKINKEERYIKQTKYSTFVLFGFLIVLEIIMFSDILQINKII